MDLAHDPLERGARVHQRERLLDEGLEPLRGLGESLPHPVRAEDRHPVPGDEQGGVARGHGPERRGPFRGVALRLLGIARVGRHPEEEIAGPEHAALRPPDPGVVVRLPAGVLELERAAARLDAEPPLVGGVRIDVLARPRRRPGELARVDQPVVSGGGAIAVEARNDVGVRHHPGRGPSALVRLRPERGQAEGVIGVAVRVDRVPDRRRVHRADRREGPVPGGLARAVDQEQAVPRAHHRHVGEGVQEEDAVGDLLDGAGRLPQRVRLDQARPGPLGQLPDSPHAARSVSSASGARRRRACATPRSAPGARGSGGGC